MEYDEYLLKCRALKDARKQLKLGKISPEEFSKKYVGVPSEPLPYNFNDLAFNECDYYREQFGLTGDGKLYEVDWNIFPDDPDHVYFVYDTIFRGEYDDDYKVAVFPVHAFNDEKAMDEYVESLKAAYEEKQKAVERKRQRDNQISQYQKDFGTELCDERNLRIEQSDWKRLRKKYIPEEFEWIVNSFIKRGILDKEHKQDYINYLKIDLL